ncbi:glycosyl transferase family 2 [Alkalibaculum bacchi]|uniref:Glycosyl transferase family 2 n=1 Tax=Alkalibaculum bacchi TaxID=645887 RepID=A0A366HZS3_9FIRM|nr:glycosyltransferase [Alkalibaculum bacchi]RBP58081.1 glycosyl transferase family 2 [Alkalibaculum bacchi]
MNNTKYSVLMSIYHKEKPDFFIESIESMLRQTIKPDEIVIVKDGPITPELEKIIDIYIQQEPGLFTIVPLKKNLGLGLALNEGLKQCKNELVARMDTDDISLENRCELQLKEFENNSGLCIVGTWTNEFYDEPSNIVTSRIVPEKHEDIMRFSRRRSPFNHPTVMYKKSAVLDCGGYQDVLRKEDIDLFIRMLHNGCLSMNIPKPLLLFRSNEDNYKRRKTWVNCRSYISVIYKFWKKGYSSTTDLVVVVIGQVVMFLSPVWLLKILSDNILRRKK